jgi:hypothetical protein
MNFQQLKSRTMALNPETNPMSRGTPMKLSVLLCCVAAVLAAGCGEPLPEEVLGQVESAERGDPCPIGTCTNPKNGQGIYIAEGSSYCIYFAPERNYFCPEHFSNLTNGTVMLRGQSVNAAQGFPNPPAQQGFVAGGRLGTKAVQVIRVDTDASALAVTIVDSNGDRKRLTGDDVKDLRLEFPANAPQFTLRFQPVAPENQVSLYGVEYSLGQTNTWLPYCADGVGLASFLPQKNVHSVSAKIGFEPEDTTMACRSGAITTCAVWGYKPWEAKDKEQQQQLDFIYGSCLQAKRAAYFVQSGDFKSYTVSGTTIAVQDKYQILNSLMPGVEAVWTPEGASCFSPQFRRVPPQGSPAMPALPVPNNLPLCDGELDKAAREGALMNLLTDGGPLATGPHI